VKRIRAHRMFFVLCLALLSTFGLTGAESAPIVVPPTTSRTDSPIDPVSGLRSDGRNSALLSPATAAIASAQWTKYEGNPVFGPGPSGSWDSSGVGTPSILFKAGHYELWYSGYSGPNSSYRIGFATSPDGVNWTRSQNNPVLTAGSPGAWDSGYVIVPHVVFHDGIYKMWYRGTDDPTAGLHAGIGYATSTDGATWVKYGGNPVLTVGSDGSWDDEVLFSANVLIEGSTYKMWYSGVDETGSRIGYATSPDGVNWTKYAGNPVLGLGSPGSWDSTSVYYPNVLHNGSTYEMWYSGANGSAYAIGYATSTDGVNWDRYPENPVVTTGPADSWDSKYVLASTVIAQPGMVKMWYTGRDASNVNRIGYAVSPGGVIRFVYLPLTLR
jgi:predicted GH43/DUF377 family glycosyl hydrolase